MKMLRLCTEQREMSWNALAVFAADQVAGQQRSTRNSVVARVREEVESAQFS